MRILITGATGFIGSRLVKRLSEYNHEIYCLARRTSNIKKIEKYNITIIYGDLTDKNSLKVIPKDIEVVFHLAAYVDFSAISESAKSNMIRQNVNASENLFNAVTEENSKLKKFIFFSSLAAMGFQRGVTVSNDTEPNPDTIYGESKYQAEKRLKELSKECDAELIILRPSLVYGIGDRSSDFLSSCKMIKKGVFPIFGSGKNIMSPFIFLDDLIEICMKFLEFRISGTFICARDERFTIKEFVNTIASLLNIKKGFIPIPVFVGIILITPIEIICKLFNIPAPLNRRRVVDLSVDRLFSDIHKDLKNAINYVPEHNLIEGSKSAINWYKKNNLL